MVCRQTEGLIQDGKSIPHPSFGPPSNHTNGLRIIADSLLVQNGGQVALNVLNLDGLEFKALNPREDGGWNLMEFRCRQDKDHILSRFFQSLQEGIEGSHGQHVNLVNDIDLILGQAGCIGGLVSDVTDFINPVIGGRINLDDIF